MPGKKRRIEKNSKKEKGSEKEEILPRGFTIEKSSTDFFAENPVQQISLGAKLIAESQSKLIKRIEDNELLIEKLRKDNENFISELRKKDSIIRALNQRIFELNESLADRERFAAGLQSRILDADSIISRQKQETESLKVRIFEMEQKNDELMEKIQNLDFILSEKKKIEVALSEKEKTITELNSKLMNLSSERLNTDQKFSELKQKLSDADRIIRRFRTENSELSEKLNKLEEEGIELKKRIAENTSALNFENLRKSIEEREDEIRELKKTILKSEEEKRALLNKVDVLEKNLSERDSAIKNLERSIGERDKIDVHFKGEISELKKRIEEKESTIRQLRFHFAQRNKIDEQLNSDIIVLKKNLEEKENMLQDLMARNKALVEMGRVSDIAARETLEMLTKLNNENKLFKIEITKLKTLISEQQMQHSRFVEGLKRQFETEKQLLVEKSTGQEVSLRARIRELEDGLRDAEKALLERNAKIKLLIKSLNEKSEQLMSDLDASRVISRKILDQPMPQFRKLEEGREEKKRGDVKERDIVMKGVVTVQAKKPAEIKDAEVQSAKILTKRTERARERAGEKPGAIIEMGERERVGGAEPLDGNLRKMRVEEIVPMIEIAMEHDAPERIRSSLLKSGYTKEEIDAAFERLRSEKG